MRFLITTLLASLLAGPIWAAEPPALTMQTKPIGEMLDDVRAAAKMIGGEPLLKQFNSFLKGQKGDQVLGSLDLKKPIAAYVFLTGKEDKDHSPPIVIVMPTTNAEQLMAAMVDEDRKWTPVEGDKGLYKLASKEKDGQPDFARVVNGLAYMLANGESKLIEKSQLVPYEKLINPKEKAWLAVRFNFARMPAELRTKAGETIDEALKGLKNAPLPPEATASMKQVTEMVQKMTGRILNQLKEADEATFRMNFDNKSGEMALEFGLSGLPGSSLAKDIAARGKTTNRFGSFVSKDTVFGLTGSAPLMNKEIGTMFGTSLEETAKEKLNELPPPVQPLVEQLFKGLSRTMKTGELDWGLCLNGPDKDGKYTAIVGLSFDDTASLEKEVKTLIQENAPPEFAKLIKLDAAKVGQSTIHIVTPPEGVLPPQVLDIFGEKAAIGLAFTPKSILVAISSDPIATLKPIVNAEPKPARALDLVMNSARIAKFATLVSPDSGDAVMEMLGNKDERYSAFFADLEGGTELKLKIGLNIKLFGQAILKGLEASGIKPIEK